MSTSRVYFWKPQWHWHGWKTLIPFFMGEDEDGKRTAVFGWTITGRAIVRLWDCKDPDCLAFRGETFEQYSDRLNDYVTSPKGIEAARAKPATATYTRKKITRD